MLSFLPAGVWPYLILVSTDVVCGSALLTQSPSSRGHFRPSRPQTISSRLTKSQVKALTVARLVNVVLGLGTVVPAIGLPIWISVPCVAPWVLSVVDLYIVAFDFWLMRVLGDKLSNNPDLWTFIVPWGTFALIVGRWIVVGRFPGQMARLPYPPCCRPGSGCLVVDFNHAYDGSAARVRP